MNVISAVIIIIIISFAKHDYLSYKKSRFLNGIMVFVGTQSVFVLLMFPISETPGKYYHVVANVVFQT